MEPETVHRPAVAAVWIAAIASAFIAAAILYDALPGINWVLWVASAAAPLIVARKLSGLAVDDPFRVHMGILSLVLGLATIIALRRCSPPR